MGKNIGLKSVLLATTLCSSLSFAQTIPADLTTASRLTQSQLAMADRVYTGKIYCEGKKDSVDISRIGDNAGYFSVRHDGHEYIMRPAIAAASIVRLEDLKYGVIWVQVSNTSMLLDTRRGNRIVGDCMNAQQAQITAAIDNDQEHGSLNVVAQKKH